MLTSERTKALNTPKQTLALGAKAGLQTIYFQWGYQTIGGYYYYRSNLPLARQYFDKALAVAEQLGDKTLHWAKCTATCRCWALNN